MRFVSLNCLTSSIPPKQDQVWDAAIEIEDIGVLGDCEAHRERLGRGRTMGAHELWWMTDRTPHESLPLPAGTYRQLRARGESLCFRLIYTCLFNSTSGFSCVLSFFRFGLSPSSESRRYFRLVTNSVSAWYSRHSTANPLGTLPDCAIVDIDKFEEAQRMLAAEAVPAPAAAAGSADGDAQK